MGKKTCSKGHTYDSAIYGDICPFCPSKGTGTVFNNNVETEQNYGFTEPNQGRTVKNSSGTMADAPTIPMGNGMGSDLPGYYESNPTVFRRVGDLTGTLVGNRIVGIFVTYDTKPEGEIFPIFEGKTSVGRYKKNDIVIHNDPLVSGTHMIIRYLEGEFEYRDEMSANGVYQNNKRSKDGLLTSYDVIRIGSTNLLFIALPQISKENEPES